MRTTAWDTIDELQTSNAVPGECLQAEGLDVTPGFVVRWESLEVVDCREPRNGTIIGDGGDGEGCDDVYEFYESEVIVPSGAVIAGGPGNCTVFSETGNLVGGYVDPDDS